MNGNSTRMTYVGNIEKSSPGPAMESLTILTDRIETANIMCLIHSEFIRAVNLHPVWPKDNASRFLILAEELGEIAKAINDGDRENLKEEIIQTGAMCLRMLFEIGGDDEG